MKKQLLLTVILAVIVAVPAFTQLAPPNSAGAAIGHIHLNASDVEVQQNIDSFVAKLQAAGIKTGGAIRNSANAAGLRIVYVTDTWGTEIEITEGLAPKS